MYLKPLHFFPLYTLPLCNNVYNVEWNSTEIENILCAALKKTLKLFGCSFINRPFEDTPLLQQSSALCANENLPLH